MEDDAEFAELFGSAPAAAGSVPVPSKPTAASFAAPAPSLNTGLEEDDLYGQLYATAAVDEDAHAYEEKPQPAASQPAAAPGLPTPGAAGAVPGLAAAAAPAAKAEAVDDDDDDFEILLDEDGPTPMPQGVPPGLQHQLSGQGSLPQPPDSTAASNRPQSATQPPRAPRGPVACVGAASALVLPSGATAPVGAPEAGVVPPGLPRPPPGPPPGYPGFGSGSGGYVGAAFTQAAAPLSATNQQQLAYVPMGMAGMQVAAALRNQDAVWPSQDTGSEPLKLPKQTRVGPEEYQEFLRLGHGEIFLLDLERVTEAPWRAPNADVSDYFNYGLTERTWREYQRQVGRFRAEFTYSNPVEIYGSTSASTSAVTLAEELAGLPAEVVAAVIEARRKAPGGSDLPDLNPVAISLAPCPGRTAATQRRVADVSVVITLVEAQLEDDAPAAADSNSAGARVSKKQPVTSIDYDPPSVPAPAVSGIPKLHPATVGPDAAEARQRLANDAAKAASAAAGAAAAATAAGAGVGGGAVMALVGGGVHDANQLAGIAVEGMQQAGTTARDRRRMARQHLNSDRAAEQQMAVDQRFAAQGALPALPMVLQLNPHVPPPRPPPGPPPARVEMQQPPPPQRPQGEQQRHQQQQRQQQQEQRQQQQRGPPQQQQPIQQQAPVPGMMADDDYFTDGFAQDPGAFGDAAAGGRKRGRSGDGGGDGGFGGGGAWGDGGATGLTAYGSGSGGGAWGWGGANGGGGGLEGEDDAFDSFDAPGGAVNAPPRGGRGSGGGGGCFICGDPGHVRRDCPNAGPRGSGGGGPGAGGCFNCGGPHMARDCPMPRGGGPPGPGGDACNICGQRGHWARNCPNNQQCYVCNGFGHFARECPNHQQQHGGPQRRDGMERTGSGADRDRTVDRGRSRSRSRERDRSSRGDERDRDRHRSREVERRGNDRDSGRDRRHRSRSGERRRHRSRSTSRGRRQGASSGGSGSRHRSSEDRDRRR